MEIYYAFIIYSIRKNDLISERIVRVDYDDKNISDEEVIELANEKINQDRQIDNFTIEGFSTQKRDSVNSN